MRETSRDLPRYHNMPFYLTAYVHDMVLRCALIDPGSSLNIMSFSMLEVGEIPPGRIFSSQLKCQVSEVVHLLPLAI